MDTLTTSKVLSFDVSAELKKDYLALTCREKSVEDTNLSPKMVEIRNTIALRQDLWWTLELNPGVPYYYFMDNSKQQDGTVRTLSC